MRKDNEYAVTMMKQECEALRTCLTDKSPDMKVVAAIGRRLCGFIPTEDKPMIFTVADTENFAKPIVYAKMTTVAAKNEQEIAEALVKEWCNDNATAICLECDDQVEDIAYTLRKCGSSWYGERFNFELTELSK